MTDDLTEELARVKTENERLRALLVATESVFIEAVSCVDNCCDCLSLASDQTLRPRITEALVNIHTASIGGGHE